MVQLGEPSCTQLCERHRARDLEALNTCLDLCGCMKRHSASAVNICEHDRYDRSNWKSVGVGCGGLEFGVAKTIRTMNSCGGGGLINFHVCHACTSRARKALRRAHSDDQALRSLVKMVMRQVVA